MLAPDSFKGTIMAAALAAALASGWADVDTAADFVHRSMADGGEGTVAAFAAAVPGARRIAVTVEGPAGAAIETAFCCSCPRPPGCPAAPP
ncbi:glycerate kinase [Microbacterium sp. cx-55]|uniref:glycerate kinase n=1 Tax=Microbacterium sp. cx-55 TaxID=2875948 RepID=UPI0022AC836A|nr:glycerate kinase [Microbacterium sp. cx-55]